MRTWPVLLSVVCLAGQDIGPQSNPVVGPTPAPRFKLLGKPLTPAAMLQAMLAQDQAQKAQPGATVEVIGTDEETALKLLSLKVVRQVRLEFRIMDKRQQQELYAFMHQDPSHPAPVLFIP